jgi:hypothetical protein
MMDNDWKNNSEKIKINLNNINRLELSEKLMTNLVSTIESNL